jgi:hypothetical protein
LQPTKPKITFNVRVFFSGAIDGFSKIKGIEPIPTFFGGVVD